jgi:hypothetical protein
MLLLSAGSILARNICDEYEMDPAGVHEGPKMGNGGGNCGGQSGPIYWLVDLPSASHCKRFGHS